MFYDRGIFDDTSCCEDQVHAMLIVGYGHDSDVGLDYCLLKNRLVIAYDVPVRLLSFDALNRYCKYCTVGVTIGARRDTCDC